MGRLGCSHFIKTISVSCVMEFMFLWKYDANVCA